VNRLQQDLLERFVFFFLLGPIVISVTVKLLHFPSFMLLTTLPVTVIAAVVIVVAFPRPWFTEEPQPTTPGIPSEESGVVPFGLDDKHGL
jgi:hypothetical protein